MLKAEKQGSSTEDVKEGKLQKGGRREHKNLLAFILILVFVQQSSAQNPEIHQAAGITRFTGIYSFLGSFIALREIYFLASLVCVLVAGNVFLTFFQLPSYYLPIYHNQRSSADFSISNYFNFPTVVFLVETLTSSLTELLQILDILEEFMTARKF